MASSKLSSGRFYAFILVAYSLLAAVYIAWAIFFLPFCLHLRALKSEHWTPLLLDACLGAYVIVLFLLLRNSPVCKSKSGQATTS